MPSRANILLVDDHYENLVALEAILENLGQNLVLATSGAEALKCLLERDFAVILLDVQMADIDGFETARLIKERERSQQIPIIFITAYSPSDTQIFQGYSIGAVDYLFKPLNPQVLRAKVIAFVELFNMTREVKEQAEAISAVNMELEAQINKVNRLNRELENINRELESFSYSVSHDLRAPLRSISGFSQALMEDYEDKLDEQGKEYLHWIETSCKQMGELIDGLLQLARLTSTPMERFTVNISELAHEISQQLIQSDPERNVKFSIQPNLVVQADRRLVRILLENLLNNAWKFTRLQQTGSIIVGSRDGAFFVSDNGVGFNMEYVDQLFQPFHRLHGDEFEGEGIGLATVRRIVHRHSGKIWVESTPKQGTTFYFTLA
jgi:two-component system, sensor histidine kinase and response regulator